MGVVWVGVVWFWVIEYVCGFDLGVVFFVWIWVGLGLVVYLGCGVVFWFV